MPADWIRPALLLPVPVVAGVAALAAPVTATDWARAGALLAAAVVQAEITRRTQTARRDASPAMVSVWSLAAAVSVHLTLAVALILAFFGYRYLRERRLDTSAGAIAWSMIAAYFAASAWESVFGVVAAAVAHLVVGYLLTSGVSFRHITDIGLDAALLIIGAMTGALMANAPVVVVIAIPVVITLHNAALTQQLEVDAAIDQKTGLANTATWQAAADRAFAGEHGEIGVLMVDLDHFKRLNDTYGHRAGDDVLTAVGACLRSQLRQTDLAGRFGGEEFTVLLPETDLIDTMTTAERIRAAIAALRVPTIDNNGASIVITDVTASIGAATSPHHGTTAEDCLRVADNRVYQAKESGRNTVVGNSTENLASYPVRPKD